MEVKAFRLQPNEDIKKWLDSWSKEQQVNAACILACVGSLQCLSVRYAGREDITFLKEKFEIISLVGTLSKHGSHLHIAVADENGKVIGGHLKEGSLVNTTAEIVVGVLSGFEFQRNWDDATGFKELTIQ
ncbi:MAG: PPC domain-containing DNA-binding protein [Chitinophagales bacterium]